MSRLEIIEGTRWATQVCYASSGLLSLPNGHELLMRTLRLGLIEKPADYSAGVIGVIRIVEDAELVSKLGAKHASK